MTFDDKPLSAAAMLDEEHWQARLKKVAEDAAAAEPPPRAVAPIRSGITRRQLDKALTDLLKRMGEIIGKELRALRQRVAELEAREWVGVFEQGKAYAKGAIVSHAGSAWVATRAYPEAKPGDGANSGWRLICKRGRDGRDAR